MRDVSQSGVSVGTMMSVGDMSQSGVGVGRKEKSPCES